jgi:hypothetical protein
MNEGEKFLLFLIINAWNQKKCWTNFKALWSTFDSWVWFGERLYIIIRNTINGKYKRVCREYAKRILWEDVLPT